MTTKAVDFDTIFDAGGLISQSLPAYELRDEQTRLYQEIRRAFQDDNHILAEAGTGVGKSFAYLMAAIERIILHKETVVISTHTLNLQDQLFEKDLPFLEEALGIKLNAVLAKGRGNYICLRRFQANHGAGAMFDEVPGEAEALTLVSDWLNKTKTGDKRDFASEMHADTWTKINVEAGNCGGRSCKLYDECFFIKSRDTLQKSKLIITNHALFFADLALRDESFQLLPDYKRAILDEGHSVEDIAARWLGWQLNSASLLKLFKRLYNTKSEKGILAPFANEDLIRSLQECRDACIEFFNRLSYIKETEADKNGRIRKAPSIENNLSPLLLSFAALLNKQALLAADDGDGKELEAKAEQLCGIAQGLCDFLKCEDDGQVRWMEQAGRDGNLLQLESAPIEIAPLLNENLFKKVPSVALVSATLSVGDSPKKFNFIRQRLGLQESDEVSTGSPFDYEQQASLVLAKSLPPPQAQNFLDKAIPLLEDLIVRQGGHALVLCTSFYTLNAISSALKPTLSAMGITLLTQGSGLSTGELLTRFREDISSVLIGVDSFWQGVDVPGESLRTLIMMRLPFQVPDQPLISARIEQIEKQGGNAFMEYNLPNAVLKFKQGFGRLIRTKTDSGEMVILDNRVLTKRYGKTFLNSLPEMQREII